MACGRVVLLTWRCIGETAIEFPFSVCGIRCQRRLLAIEPPFHTEAAPAEAKTRIALDGVYPFHRLGRSEDPRIGAVVHAQISGLVTAAGAVAPARRHLPSHDYYYCHTCGFGVCTRLRQTIQYVRGRRKSRGDTSVIMALLIQVAQLPPSPRDCLTPVASHLNISHCFLF